MKILKIKIIQGNLNKLFKHSKRKKKRTTRGPEEVKKRTRRRPEEDQKKPRRRPEEYILRGNAMGIKVLDNNLEVSLRKFKKLVKESGVLFEVKERREFRKPSAIKRRKMQSAVRRQYHQSLAELEERSY